MENQENQMDLSELWNNETEHENISIDDLDNVVREYEQARTVYEAKSKESKEAHKILEERKLELYNLLQRAGKSKWEVEGIGKVSSYETMSFKTPKDPTAKKELAEYMQNKYGKETFWEMFSVNSMTLNSWAKQEFENDKQLLKIPGVDEPVARENIRFTRSK